MGCVLIPVIGKEKMAGQYLNVSNDRHDVLKESFLGG